MTRLAHLAATGAVVATTLATAGTAHAAKECTYDLDKRAMRCRITAPPSAPETVIAFDSAPIGWRRNIASAGQAVGFCIYYETITGVQNEVVGIPWIVELYDTATGATISTTAVCEYPGDPSPEPPPPPPTPDRYLEAIEALLQVDYELSPPAEFEGITGVDTWFWCDSPGTVTIDPITLDGWTVRAEMTPITFDWSVAGPGDGGSHSGDTCGSEPDLDGDGDGAAWTWQPQTMGDYTIEFSTTWLGTWTLTWDGTTTGTYPLGPAPIDQPTLAYPVGEYRGVLVPGDDR